MYNVSHEVNEVPNTMEGIKERINESKGQPVLITAQLGRHRMKKQRGVIAETYPAIFVVKLAPESALGTMDRVSYTYTDILTKEIAVDFIAAETEE